MTDAEGPSHHDRPMYHEERDGTDMRRWLCAEPGCTAALSDDQLASVRDQDWAEAHGMIAPGWQVLS